VHGDGRFLGGWLSEQRGLADEQRGVQADHAMGKKIAKP
jgi:hypothetical protein